MSENGTFGQAQQVLNLFIQKNMTTEKIHELYCSGLLSDLLEADIKNVNREEFQKVIGIFGDFFIEPDRSVRPSYPEWVEKLLYPEMESVGPKKIDLRKLRYVRHPLQYLGLKNGVVIMQYLKDKKLFKKSLNLQDGLAIKEKGVNLFRKLFTIQSTYLWGSVVISDAGGYYVPYLTISNNEVVLNWEILNNSWKVNEIALIHK